VRRRPWRSPHAAAHRRALVLPDGRTRRRSITAYSLIDCSLVSL
jgi:hypothetical protein